MTAQPERLVLLGHALGHTLSPRMQNAALKAAGIDVVYSALDVPRSALADTIATLRRDRAAGNVTVPYKQDVFDACDRLTEEARAIGAVNTFWTSIDGALVGDNTDAPGFEKAIEQQLGAVRNGERAALLGAGGAAAAVLHAMERWPNVRVRLYSRTRDRAERLATRFRMPITVEDSAQEAVKGMTLVVNATPVGLRDDAVPIPVNDLPDGCDVYDLVYRPKETAFVRAARARGHRASDGLVMLVEQGALAFERWFGIKPDRTIMLEAVKSPR